MKRVLPFVLLAFCGTSFANSVMRAPNQITAGSRLWESFEAYPNNDDMTWTPAGWTFLSKAGNIPDPKLGITWHVQEGIAMFNMLATDGQYIAYLNGAFSSEGQTQDEWMISPAFTPVATDYLLFDANYAPIFMFIDYVESVNTGTIVFDFEHPYNTLQALVSVDNSAHWDTIWDASVGDYDEDNIWDFADNTWYKISISLADYAGQPIRVAFRLVGNDAQSSAIDHIRVNELASYNIPPGFFYGGLDTHGYSLPATMMTAAYVPTSWTTSETAASGYEWTLPEIEGTGTYLSKEASPTATYIYDAYYFPSLSVINDDVLSEPYCWAANQPAYFEKPVFFAGGNYNDWLRQLNVKTPDGKLVETFGVGNYDLFNNIEAIALSPNNYLFGTDISGLKTAFGNYFDKPQQAYHLKGVRIATTQMKAPAHSELTLRIYRIDSKGYLQDIIATSQWKTNQAIPLTDFYTLSFDMDVVIGDAVLMVLSGFDNQAGLQFCVYSEKVQNSGISNAYVYAKINGSEPAWVSSSELLESGVVPALCFTLNLDYSFIASSDKDYRFVAEEVGSKKSFKLNHWADFDEQWSDRLPSWVSSQFSKNEKNELIYTLTLTKELPEGFETRYTNVELMDGRGAKALFAVAQGVNPWSLPKIKTLPQVKAWIANDYLIANYPPEIFQQVEILNLAGQIIEKHDLPENGEMFCPVHHLSRGVYLVRFLGKAVQTVKLVRP